MNLSSVLLLLSLLGIILALWLQVKSQRAIIIKSKKPLVKPLQIRSLSQTN